MAQMCKLTNDGRPTEKTERDTKKREKQRKRKREKKKKGGKEESESRTRPGENGRKKYRRHPPMLARSEK